jgi:hypothetical protein
LYLIGTNSTTFSLWVSINHCFGSLYPVRVVWLRADLDTVLQAARRCTATSIHAKCWQRWCDLRKPGLPIGGVLGDWFRRVSPVVNLRERLAEDFQPHQLGLGLAAGTAVLGRKGPSPG